MRILYYMYRKGSDYYEPVIKEVTKVELSSNLDSINLYFPGSLKIMNLPIDNPLEQRDVFASFVQDGFIHIDYLVLIDGYFVPMDPSKVRFPKKRKISG